MISGLLGHRRALVAASIGAGVALASVALTQVQVPVFGLGRLLYIPIVLLALGSGPLWGSLAGAVAGGFYTVGNFLNPHLANDHFISLGGLIRLAAFTAIGWVVGSSAARDRELAEQVRELAERDFLTDLFNTRAFEAALAERLDRGHDFALILADVNGLDLVNETEGHAAGNEHLRRLAAVLREETAPGDTIARIGGDEFVILKEVDSQPEAEDICDRLRDALAVRGISVNFGYAVSPDEGDDQLSLFHGADKRLYACKLAGSRRRLRAVS